ncbi:family 43 glycosylhydrolase [Sphingobacterium sp. LRF_L2]|uniref:family 43 glycosylhydrolase n=1 Tax=Sphingobacterium sp. LRF_L2 TaxID=3369421 RepID=UPI003F5F8471
MRYILITALIFLVKMSFSQSKSNVKTYCNPINIDYGYTPIPTFSEWGRHRTTADPVIVNYKNDYYLFSTNQWGYWWSPNMHDWTFNAKKFLRPWNGDVYDELCAPAVGVLGDTMLVFGSTYTDKFSIWMSTDPKANEWKPLVDSFEIGGWDPDFFTDTDGRFYMYNGSSNKFPLYGIELDRKTMKPKGTRKELLYLEDWRYGWQRFGEYNDNTFLDPFLEGAHMTKHNNKYYFQFAGPGTEFSGYADGVAIGETPLGPFEKQSDPLSYKPGGFARGAGHGSTFKDKRGQYWHVSTIVLGVKNNFERRLGIWPTYFDKDDVMYTNTAFGDYPHYLPDTEHPGQFTGWMLLNYKKPVTVSSTLGSFSPNNAVDESMKTYWSATSAAPGEWITTDLGSISTVHAIQINYADQDVDNSFLGKINNIFHQYKLYTSIDGKKWNILVNKSENKTDVPHEYVELKQAVQARFIKLENIHMPSGKFAISGLRVFGYGRGNRPHPVKQFTIMRTEKDKRSAWIKWNPVSDAYAYNIYTGIAPDKLYNCVIVHDANDYYYKAMDSQKAYYFTIEAINENGISTRFPIVKVD